jgi:uncharacterized protein DUF6058
MLTDADRDYVLASFVSLSDLAGAREASVEEIRNLIEDGRLPRPSYVMDDGTEMVPADYFRLVDEAGGVEALRESFLARYREAAGAETARLDDAETEWRSYLSGEYGVCLRTVTPETIVRKSALVGAIEGLLSKRRPDDPRWGEDLRRAVEELDALERPFAPHYDRTRFGGPSSRDRLITAVHAEYPEIFATGTLEVAGP